MVIKRKDFQKAAAFINEFLLKLGEGVECAELRDSLNLTLLYMQRYYRTLRLRSQSRERTDNQNEQNLGMSVRGLSPMTPFRDVPDKFHWRWINIDSPKVSGSLPLEGDLVTLPLVIQAAKQGDIELIEQLLEKDKRCIDQTDSHGRTCVMYAVHFKQNEALKILLDNGADVNAVAYDGSTAVHRACCDGHHEALRILIDHQADLTTGDCMGRAPVHWAVSVPEQDCLKLLLEHEVSINVRDKDGMTPSMWACRMDHIQHFELLTSVDDQWSSGDGLERDNHGKTWMHWSVRKTEPLECLQTFLTQESAAIKDDEGKTVMLTAAEQGSVVAMKTVLEIGGEDVIYDEDNQGRTSLHLATIGGHGECINFLLEHGVDLSKCDKSNATAMDYAKARHLNYSMMILSAYQRQRDKQNRKIQGNSSPEHEQSDEENKDNNLTNKHQVAPPHPPSHPKSGTTPKQQNVKQQHWGHMVAPEEQDSGHSTQGETEKPNTSDKEITQDNGVGESSTGQMMRMESVESTEDENNNEGKQQPGQEQAPDDEEDHSVSIGGMDVSDCEGEEEQRERPTTPHPQKRHLPSPPTVPPRHHIPTPTGSALSPVPVPPVPTQAVGQTSHPPPLKDVRAGNQNNLQGPAVPEPRKMPVPPPQLMPLGTPMSQEDPNKGNKKTKKKKKGKDMKGEQGGAELAPVRGYTAPIQAPLPQHHPVSPAGGLQPPKGGPGVHMQKNGPPQDQRMSPEGQWFDDQQQPPPRPGAPLPPHSPLPAPPHGRPAGAPLPPPARNGGGQQPLHTVHQGPRLQRMESEENLSALDLDDSESSGQQLAMYEQ
ncbi:inversin-A-like, partial [Lingula anatina]|uniref:Inversin-A-like n=1 Tax=Lingula anatina TaxID=7574 RepID=A0A1S3I869_LINAN